jgi:integrase
MNALTSVLGPAPLVSVASPVPPSFAIAANQVMAWTELPETRRRDMASALMTAARMLGLPPEAVPCEVAWLNARLFQRPPASFGIGARRFRNVMSDLRAVLRRLGLHAERGYGEVGLPEAWRDLLGGIRHPAQRAGLRAFARFCAGRSLGPAEISDQVLAAYAAEDAASRLSAGGAGRAADIARVWNSIIQGSLSAATLPSLTAPRRREPYTLPFEAYPISFQAEVARFRDRLACATGTEVFALDGPGRRLRPATVAVRVFALRQAAAALVLQGMAPTDLTSLRDLVEPVERAGRILDHFHQRADGRAGGQMAIIAETLRQVAKYQVRLAGPALQQIEAWCRRTRPRRQQGLSGKVRDRLRRLIEPRSRALLLHLPGELLRRARQPNQDASVAARWAMLATAIEILLVCPLRMRNLTGLRLDQHLQRLDVRGNRITHLILAETETKNSEALEWPLPPESAKLIDAYIRDFRPSLASGVNPYLFPGADGGSRTQNALAVAITGIIEREVGVRVHPHLLRHFAAWLHLSAYPGEYEMVRRVLGHRSVQTTITMYCGLEAPAAAKRFDAVVLRERASSQAVAAAAWRRPARRKGDGA